MLVPDRCRLPADAGEVGNNQGMQRCFDFSTACCRFSICSLRRPEVLRRWAGPWLGGAQVAGSVAVVILWLLAGGLLGLLLWRLEG